MCASCVQRKICDYVQNYLRLLQNYFFKIPSTALYCISLLFLSHVIVEIVLQIIWTLRFIFLKGLWN
jgi:hypothetical protein